MKQINSQKIQNKLRNKFIKSGVKMTGPETIFFSEDTKIGKNVIIDPYVVIGQKVKIGNNVRIHSFCHLEDSKIENNATNTGATSGDLKCNAYGVSGFILIELRKDEAFTA